MKVYHHHPTPFVFTVFKVIFGVLPFFVFLYFFNGALSAGTFWTLALVLLFIFVGVLIYVSLLYWLDRLIVSNERVIFVDYQWLGKKLETELEITDIQEIVSHENGIFAYFRIFDYGFVELDTPASNVPLHFPNASNPDGIRQFIYHIKNL